MTFSEWNFAYNLHTLSNERVLLLACVYMCVCVCVCSAKKYVTIQTYQDKVYISWNIL